MNYYYGNIPPRLIPLAYNTNGLEKLILYSLYTESLRKEYSMDIVAKHILYLFLLVDSKKHRIQIPNSIIRTLTDMDGETEYIGCSDEYSEYRSFYPGDEKFCPLDVKNNSVTERLIGIFRENNLLWDSALRFYRIYMILKKMDLRINYTIEDMENAYISLNICDNSGREIQDEWKSGYGSVNLEKALRLLYEEKKLEISTPLTERKTNKYLTQLREIEEHKVRLAACIAMNSIKGAKAIGNATKSQILARMVGKKEIDADIDINDSALDAECKKIFKRYNNYEYFQRLMGLMRTRDFKFIEPQGKSGFYYSTSRDMTVEEFQRGMKKIMDDKGRKSDKYYRRRKRYELKHGTFKSQKLTPNVSNGDAPMQPQKPQQQFNVPTDAPFLPVGDYPQPTGNVPQKYQQQPAIQQPMQQQMPFPTMQGYQTVQQQPPQMEAPPFPPFAK